MACLWIKLPNGTTAHIRYTPPRPRQCRFCKQRPGTKLCDFIVGPDEKTCNASMCGSCATVARQDLDYCPRHKDGQPQRHLFNAPTP